MTTEAPTAPSRDWLSRLPSDWNSWLQFAADASASRAARDSLREHLAKHANPETDHRALGLGLFAASQRAAALPHLLQAGDELCRFLAGRAQADQNDLTGALQTWAQLGDSAEFGVPARLARMNLLGRLRDEEALEKELAALRGKSPRPADLAYAEGMLAEAAGDHAGAIASWRLALTHDPDHDLARFRLAHRLDLDGEDDEALNLFRANLDSGRPVHIGTLMNLGVLYEDREEYDAAARCFRAVLKDDPTNSRARRYLADAEASRRQFYDESRERKADMQNAVLRIPVTDFELSVRARNCLQRMNIHTLGDLIGRTESELLSFKNFGETSLQEVKDILAMKGLRLGMVTPEPGDEDEDDVGEIVGLESLVAEAPPVPETTDIQSRSVASLDLSVRSRAALATLGIKTVGDLAGTSEETLLACKNFGQTSLAEVKAKLKDLGLSLGS
ncbi:MAG TPA: DNA-directed RNA polymerase subunit alpha C-terminal domain-containing protein [Planctomycetota bacterium]|jgi:DNA-directed RNA polymerase subunit alpha|nr:DNA-directed RNA polymerase subunit alpha C-terminal domain-containing protein [Planctomycetota bacterium]